MTRSLLLFCSVPLLAATGCLETSDEFEPGPELGDLPLPGGRRAPSILLDGWIGCGDEHCPTAVGGTREIEVYRETWDVVEPVVTGAWPLRELSLAPGMDRYALDANVAGEGTFALHYEYWQNGGAYLEEGTTPALQLRALPVAQVRVRPGSQIYEHRPFVTDRIAWHVEHAHAYVELLPPGAGVTAPPYLIDSSLALGAGNPDGVTAGFAHGAFELGHVGSYDFVVTAGSFGERRLPVTVVDHVERLEARFAQRPERVGDDGIVCFDAFTGDYELALAEWQYDIAIEGTLDRGNDHSAENCIEFHVSGPGLIRVTGTAEDQTAITEVDIPPVT